MSSVAAIPSFDQRSLRVSILGAFWAITLLALPLWWSTTNIERLSLPSISFDASLNPSLFFPVRVALDNVYFSSSFASEVQDALRSKIISDTHTSHIIAPYVVSRCVHTAGPWLHVLSYLTVTLCTQRRATTMSLSSHQLAFRRFLIEFYEFLGAQTINVCKLILKISTASHSCFSPPRRRCQYPPIPSVFTIENRANRLLSAFGSKTGASISACI